MNKKVNLREGGVFFFLTIGIQSFTRNNLMNMYNSLVRHDTHQVIITPKEICY